MVREYQREDREVVWLILDAAVEHSSGTVGQAPLDSGIDEIAALAKAHLRRGDHVGLAISGTDPSSWLAPRASTAQASKIAEALALATSVLDADRSEDDEADVARKVLDHLRFLDAASVANVRVEQLDAVHAHAELSRSRAPFNLAPPAAGSARERALRRYLGCFGISLAPRVAVDRQRPSEQLVQALLSATRDKPRASLVYVWSPATNLAPALATTLARLRRRGSAVRWLSPPIEVPAADPKELASLVRSALFRREQISRERGEQRLRAMGAHVQHRARAR